MPSACTEATQIAAGNSHNKQGKCFQISEHPLKNVVTCINILQRTPHLQVKRPSAGADASIAVCSAASGGPSLWDMADNWWSQPWPSLSRNAMEIHSLAFLEALSHTAVFRSLSWRCLASHFQELRSLMKTILCAECWLSSWDNRPHAIKCESELQSQSSSTMPQA